MKLILMAYYIKLVVCTVTVDFISSFIFKYP
jgi:hypothetical protein